MLTYIAFCLLWLTHPAQPLTAPHDGPQIRIDEVLADPPSGPAGDANKDGVRHSYQDEFIELFNAGAQPVDISGWRLGDDDTPSARLFVFPAGTHLAAGARLLLFGGGLPTGFTAAAFTDDGRIGNGLSNGGDTILLIDARGDTAARFDGSGWPQDRSLVRQTDGSYAPHQLGPFSPGAPQYPADDAPTPVPTAPDSTDLPPTDAPEADPSPPQTPPAAPEADPSPPQTPPAAPEADPSPPQTPPAAPEADTPPNHAPTFTSTPPPTARAGFTYRYRVTATDADADSLTFAVVTAPAWLTLAGDRLSGLPPDGPPLSSTVGLRLSDGHHIVLHEFELLRLPRPRLAIAEILADPAGDANGDGQSQAYGDEFIELYNKGDAVDLAGCTLSDDDAPATGRFTFPPGTLLGPYKRLTLFGLAPTATVPGLAFGDDGRIGNGLGNSGDRILLLCGPDTLIDHSYSSPANINQSLLPQAAGTHLLHASLPGRTPFSPGRARPIYTHFSLDSLTLTSGTTAPLPALLGHWAAASDSVRTDTVYSDGLIWFTQDTTLVKIRSNKRLQALWPGRALITVWHEGHILAAGPTTVLQAPDPPHDAPLFHSAPDSLAYAQLQYHYHPTASDPEGATLHFTLAQGPTWLHLDQHSGALSGRPPATAVGIHPIAIEAHDGRGGLAVQRFHLRVWPRPRVFITEILADPPPGPDGDANGDGTRHSSTDEFVELHHAGADTLYLRNGILHAGGGSFPLPPMPLPPHSYLTVFGGGPTGLRRLSAGGRIGRGLHNQRGQIALTIGPDTLDHIAYDLPRPPRQALHFAPANTAPALHGQLPGRTLYSPGKPRPQLTKLTPHPQHLDLILGDTANIRVEAQYSDGFHHALDHNALRTHLTWTADSTVALEAAGRIKARHPGNTHLTIACGTVAVPLPIRIRPALAQRLRFSPSWQQARATPGTPQIFAVDALPDEEILYNWRLNGRPRRTHDPIFTHTPSGTRSDTIDLILRTRSEHHRRRWILLPAPTTAAFPNPFNPQTSITFTLPVHGPTRLDIHAANGQRLRRLLDADLPAGSHRYTWDGRDQQGRPAATGLYFYRLQSNTYSTTGKLLLLR